MGRTDGLALAGAVRYASKASGLPPVEGRRPRTGGCGRRRCPPAGWPHCGTQPQPPRRPGRQSQPVHQPLARAPRARRRRPWHRGAVSPRMRARRPGRTRPPRGARAMDEPVRSAVRWAATHGAMRVAIRARARTGNPDAQVMTDPALRADPYAHYERLRTAAPFADGALARVSVHHDVCTDVLRSEDFGQIGAYRTEIGR